VLFLQLGIWVEQSILSVLEKHTETETAALLNILIDEVRKAQGSVKK
jgi:hypothetical protein